MGESAKKRLLDTERIKTQEYREEWKKMGGVSEEQIAEALSSQNKDSSKRKAAAMEMAEKVGFKAGDGSNPEANLERYREALKTVGDDPLYKNLFTDKVKEKHIKFVIEDDISKGKSPAEAYKEHLGKLDNEKFAKQKDLHEKIGSDPHLQEYVKERFKTNPESHKELFKRLTGDQQTRYLGVGGGVTPDLPKPPGPQGPQKIYKAS